MDGFKAELTMVGRGHISFIPNYFKISVIAKIRKESVTLYQKPYQHGTLVISKPFGISLKFLLGPLQRNLQ